MLVGQQHLYNRRGWVKVLKIKDVKVAYGKMNVLWNINIEVRSMETVALIGANGAGKTSLINTISGMVNSKGGDLLFKNKSITSMRADERVALGIIQVPEGRKLFPGMTVSENLLAGSFLRHDKDIMNDFNWILDMFPELKTKQNQLAGSLSGGEQQMVAIGRALMGAPKLLLIDEFSLGLAPVVVDRLVRSIAEIRERSPISILLVEQDVPLGLSLSDRAYVLENGHIVMSGPSCELINNKRIEESFLGL